MIKKKGDFNLDVSLREFKAKKSRLPIVIGAMAVEQFKKGFTTGGGATDEGFWKPRKKDPKGGRRAILVGPRGGTMWRAIKVDSASWSKILIGNNTQYGARHNEGLDGMPKREFMGDSNKLDRDVKDLLLKEIDRTFK